MVNVTVSPVTNFAIFSIHRVVYGPVFPCETFWVLNGKEGKQCGGYHTCRLVLEVSDNMESMHIKRSTL